MKYDKDRAEQLTARILANPSAAEVGVLANDLLDEYHRGYPLENLRPLLAHSDQNVVETGAWIASELGSRGSSLLGDVAHLLSHVRRNVKFDVIDCVLLWADSYHGDLLASAVKLLNDPDSPVRWKAMDFLSSASRSQLEAALARLEATEPNSSSVAPGVRWLLAREAEDPTKVKAALQSGDATLRMFAVVAARRIASFDVQPLRYAASLDDQDVKRFAESSIKLL